METSIHREKVEDEAYINGWRLELWCKREFVQNYAECRRLETFSSRLHFRSVKDEVEMEEDDAGDRVRPKKREDILYFRRTSKEYVDMIAKLYPQQVEVVHELGLGGDDVHLTFGFLKGNDLMD
ncbi:hypothetical protein SASPL_117293 [Salvia splendens]|uniref:Uncharacterized protein n=1 Tax=Salvia splendens TaxID=180675 RepID=A0A8X8XZ01_SALSN|nr:hypothetical protein SASPL_117293 [Salvia splendens]